MTTLDQARAVSQRLREWKAPNYIPVEGHPMLEAADIIDALQQENKLLEARAFDFENRWYQVCDVANDLRAQLRTYREREKTMGWNQS